MYSDVRFSAIIQDEGWFGPRRDRSLPISLYWTCRFGLKSWAKLGDADQRSWQSNAGNMKGLDFRDDLEQCRSINEIAYWKIRYRRQKALGDRVKGLRPGSEIGSVVNQSLSARAPTVKEWRAAVAEGAVEAYNRGYLLLAVAPDLASDKAALLMSRQYRESVDRYAKSKQRPRWEDWLPVISALEDAEVSRHKAKSQTFIRYRRILDAIRFT